MLHKESYKFIARCFAKAAVSNKITDISLSSDLLYIMQTFIEELKKDNKKFDDTLFTTEFDDWMYKYTMEIAKEKGK